MFSKIFLFEIKYRLHRPAVYIYFIACFAFTALAFANGAMPLDDKQFINGTTAIAFYVAIMSMMVMLVSSSVMGMPLYRDIEYNTKEYYLSYPITKAGYFWGRYLSSFLFVLVIDMAVLFGAYFGSKAGPAFGWESAAHYGPDHLINYLYPFLVVAIPNLFFVSSLFFGLVAITRNVKVIYSSGLLLFLGYMIGNFFINSSSNKAVIYLADPFVINAIKYERGLQTIAEKNNTLIALQGYFLLNRVIWTGVGLIIILYTYFSFNFEKFFSGRRDKKVFLDTTEKKTSLPVIHSSFAGNYRRKTLYTLTKIEVLNIMRDNYFWIIIISGAIFLGMVFRHGPGNYWVPDFPQTSTILFVFNNYFLTFIFCIIMFYTGETIHREKATRYAFINDALPPSDWIFNLAKFASIICLAVFLTYVPMLIGIISQLLSGFTHLNIGLYFTTLTSVTLPTLVEMVMFAFVLHISINNKFAALGVGIALWVLFLLAYQSGWMSYHMLLYSQTPNYGISDMDGVGHMIKPITWFNIYWLLFGALLILLGYLYYVRGTASSVKERLQIVKQRFTGITRTTAFILLAAFIAVACYVYYNVSYVNEYYTHNEYVERAAIAEKQLKHFENDPLPTPTNFKMHADIFPGEQKAVFKAFVTIANKTTRPITQLLLDGDNITDYSLKYNGVTAPYTNALMYKRGKFNFLRPAQEPSAYRLYKLPMPLAPGDSAVVEVNSIKEYKGFSNHMYGADMLHNGTLIGDGMPGIGYDDDEELTNNEDRKDNGLQPRQDDMGGNDSAGINIPYGGIKTGLLNFDVTVSTSADQVAIGPGDLEKQWTENGRNYYHYVSNGQGTYSGIGFASARYSILKDTVTQANGQPVAIVLYYQPEHNANLQRFLAAYRDGIQYYSKIYGPYPLKQMRLVESSEYNNNYNSAAGMDIYTERFGWNANFTQDFQWDYCYFVTAQQLAKQWWQHQLTPSQTKGAQIISNGLAKYNALVMMEKKFGKENMKGVINEETDTYVWNRGGRSIRNQTPIIHSKRWNEQEYKSALVLYGLRDLAGEDSVNAALHEFFNAFAFRNKPPYATTGDLYNCLKKHVPDSLQYYLTDTWEKICFYDNKVLAATVKALGNNQYKVHMKISVNKTYQDGDGNDTNATGMNDYIPIGIFGAGTTTKGGANKTTLLYLQKHRLTAGEHDIDIVVTGKPVNVSIDPYNALLDRVANDNVKELQ